MSVSVLLCSTLFFEFSFRNVLQNTYYFSYWNIVLHDLVC
nr:MAG TPA: hypothetical protein [Bacteriophage sp.]